MQESIGIILTTQSPSKSFGFVPPAIEENINPESAGRAGVVNDQESATRFLYSAKASRRERDAGLDGFEAKGGNNWGEGIGHSSGEDVVKRNTHPCLKPLDLNRYLASLILPPKRDTPRRILVPFSGSGSEMIGALLAGWDEAVGIERESDYVAIGEARLRFWTEPGAWERDMEERLVQEETFDDLPLFGACPEG